MPLVTPTPIPAYPPAPQPTDDRVTFSTKAFALSGSYEPQRIIFNTVAGEVYTNALWSQTKAVESAASASQAVTSASNAASSVTAVNQTVADILAAKDAIQAGPVASVNARTGVVTGLVETAGPVYTKATLMSAAPLGQWATFADATGAGTDWPTTLASSCWNVFTYGTSIRKTQRASQVLAGGQQGWIFERQQHDATWSSWQRIMGDLSVLERQIIVNANTATTSINLTNGSIQTVVLYQSTNIQIPAPRTIGDQLTIRILSTGAFSAGFTGATVRLPSGASLPAVPAWKILTVTFVAMYDNSGWDMFIGGLHG